MNFRTLTIAILAAGSCAAGYGKSPAGLEKVTVCLGDEWGDIDIDHVKTMASAMFRKADVTIAWKGTPAACHKGATQPIVIDLLDRAPADATKAAMARALPFEGIHIQIFRQRITYREGVNTALLAHVLVHEITHILEGLAHHSETGVMKAAWTREDYARMQSGPLWLSAQDIELIHSGMTDRARKGDTNLSLAADTSERGLAETR